MRVLIVRLSAMGDVIHTLPLARLLKKRFKKISIDWIVNTSYVPLLRGNSDIDRIIEFPKKLFKDRPFKVISDLKKRFKKRGYTHVFDPQGLAKSGLLTFLSGAESRIGFNRKTARELSWAVYNRQVEAAMFGPSVVSMNMGLAAAAGIHTSKDFLDRSSANILGPWLTSDTEFPVPYKSERYILVSPCAGWPTKEWPAEYYSEFINMISEKFTLPVKIIWAGKREKNIAEKIADNSQAQILPETDISEMLSCIKSSLLFIAGDTGPMHAANFLGVPCAAVYTASDPVRNGPWFQPALVVTPDIGCRGCMKRTCSDPICVGSVSPEKVFNAVTSRFSGLFEEFTR